MFSGSIVALVTPMSANGELDFDSLERLIEFHIEAGTDAIVAMGTTGESATLSEAEHILVVEKTLAFAAGRIPVIAGNGKNATAATVSLTRELNKFPLAGYLTVTPYYNKPCQAGMLAHFKAVAEASDKPVLLYNVPSRTGVDMEASTIAELSRIDNIVGIKEASGEIQRLPLLKELCDENFIYLSGDDMSACSFMLLGGQGVISVSANVIPDLVANMCQLALQGEAKAAAALDLKLQAAHNVMFVAPSPAPAKYWLHQQENIATPDVRLPIVALNDEGKAQVDKVREEIKVFRSSNG